MPAFILALNIFEACLRDFQCYGFGAWNGALIDNLWVMIWAWIIAYDLWNFSYTYNFIADHSFYCGLTLLLACTIPAFWIKKGAWLQHRASTLAFWIMFVMTVPSFADRIAPVSTTHNPKAFLILSILSLTANAALFIYQIYRIRQKKLHPLKDEIYYDTETYKKTIESYA